MPGAGLPGAIALPQVPSSEPVSPQRPLSSPSVASGTAVQGSAPGSMPGVAGTAARAPSATPIVSVEPPATPSGIAAQPQPMIPAVPQPQPTKPEVPVLPLTSTVQGSAPHATTAGNATPPATTAPGASSTRIPSFPSSPAASPVQQSGSGSRGISPPAFPDVDPSPKVPAAPDRSGIPKPTGIGSNTQPDLKAEPSSRASVSREDRSAPAATTVVPLAPVGIPSPPANTSGPAATSVETGRAGGVSTSTMPAARNEMQSAVIPASNTSVAAAQQRPPTTSYDEDVYETKATDTWESISQEFFNTKAYAAALRAHNKGGAKPAGMVSVPPIYILKRSMPAQGRPANIISQSAPTTTPPASPPPTAAPAANWGPTTATTPASPSPDYKIYRVPPGGANMRAIARTVLGDDQKWGEIYNLNPWYSTKDTFPEGTEIRVPPNAKLPN